MGLEADQLDAAVSTVSALDQMSTTSLVGTSMTQYNSDLQVVPVKLARQNSATRKIRVSPGISIMSNLP